MAAETKKKPRLQRSVEIRPENLCPLPQPLEAVFIDDDGGEYRQPVLGMAICGEVVTTYDGANRVRGPVKRRRRAVYFVVLDATLNSWLPDVPEIFDPAGHSDFVCFQPAGVSLTAQQKEAWAESKEEP